MNGTKGARVSVSDLGIESANADRLVAWSESGSTGGVATEPSLIKLTPFTAKAPLPLPSAAEYTLWHVAPQLCNGIVVLGETSKYIVMSPQRIASMEVDCSQGGGVALSLLGAAQ